MQKDRERKRPISRTLPPYLFSFLVHETRVGLRWNKILINSERERTGVFGCMRKWVTADGSEISAVSRSGYACLKCIARLTPSFLPAIVSFCFRSYVRRRGRKKWFDESSRVSVLLWSCCFEEDGFTALPSTPLCDASLLLEVQDTNAYGHAAGYTQVRVFRKHPFVKPKIYRQTKLSYDKQS